MLKKDAAIFELKKMNEKKNKGKKREKSWRNIIWMCEILATKEEINKEAAISELKKKKGKKKERKIEEKGENLQVKEI